MPSYEDYSWEKQKNESDKAYAAFTEFLSMGPKARSVSGVARNLSKSRQLINGWCQKYDWRNRARDYDNYILREAKAKEIKEYKSMLTRHIGISIQLQKKALDALKNLGPDGMSAKEIREYLKISTELERISRLNGISNEERISEQDILDDGFITAIKAQAVEVTEDAGDTPEGLD